VREKRAYRGGDRKGGAASVHNDLPSGEASHGLGSGSGGAEVHAQDPELERLVKAAYAEALQRGGEDEDLVRAWHFHLLYNRERGVFGRRSGNKYAMSRRKWIEGLVMIEDKRARVVPFELNQSQRNLEATILKMERSGNPVRVVILKVRQNGISTYNLALMLWLIATETNVKARVIADREELCETLLTRVKRMFQRLHKTDGSLWRLPSEKSNRDMILLGEPFFSSITVVSANTPNPGFGETNICVDMEETSKWPDASEKGKGVELALPEVPGSFAFDVSQPKGNTGYFADKFKRAWYREKGLADPNASDEDVEKTGSVDGLLGSGGWRPNFIPWFLHQEYRWTRIGSNPKTLPDQIQQGIEKTLTEEERVLLKQKYLLRGYGYVSVDYDQLAWRRYYIAEKCNGKIDSFHEQCPAFPEEAFLASGRPAFNVENIKRCISNWQRHPLRVARLYSGGVVEDDKNGELWIWKEPEFGRQYVIGVDTAAGVKGGDPCVMSVVDVMTRELVAEWYGWEPPHFFGEQICRLSDLYRADVAIETHPSQHGLAAYNAAESAGCRRLFVQQRIESRDEGWQVRKGWAMSQQAKAVILDFVAQSLRDNVAIPSQRLLQELLDAQLDDKEKISRYSRNDLIMAYGLSLAIADKARTERRTSPEPQKLPPTGSDEEFWRQRKLRIGQNAGNNGRRNYDKLNGANI
jgi:hypothetical protein